MSVLLVDGQDEADRYNVGRPSMPERVFEPNVSVMEERLQVVGALGKQFNVVRNGRELGDGVPPTPH